MLTLSTGLAGYDEVDAARRIAAACGARCEVVEAPPSAWLEALPCAVASVETPLYNLHPVGRYLLAREARRRGHDTLITGDGADAAFAAARPRLRAADRRARRGHRPGAAFTVPRERRADRHPGARRAARQGAAAPVAARRGAGVEAAVGAKRPRALPGLDLDALLQARRPALEHTARALGRTLRLDDDRARVGWLTLDLLVSSLQEAR